MKKAKKNNNKDDFRKKIIALAITILNCIRTVCTDTVHTTFLIYYTHNMMSSMDVLIIILTFCLMLLLIFVSLDIWRK